MSTSQPLTTTDGQRRLIDDEFRTACAQREATHLYDISLNSLENEAMVTAEGILVVRELPELWMAAIDFLAILNRASLAEEEDPRPICAVNVIFGNPGTEGVQIGHCIRDWHHIGEHAVSAE